MATKNSANAVESETVKGEEFPMDDEFKNDETESNDASMPNVGSLDDLTTGVDNTTRDEEEWQRLNPPKGDWEKDSEWKIAVTFRDDDSEIGDKNPAGRTTIVLMGKPKVRQANGYEYQPTFFVRLSPDRRTKQSDPSSIDLAYKLWLKAKNNLFLAINKRKAVNDKEVAVMLRDEHYIVNTMNGDNGPIVVDIKPKPKQRA